MRARIARAAALGAFAALSAAPLAATEATGPPGPSELTSPLEVVTTSSYAVSLARSSAQVVAGSPISISLGLHTLAGDLPMIATAEAFPGTDEEGQPLRVELQPAGRNRYVASLTFPTVGSWEFDVDASTLGNPPERAIFRVAVTSGHALPWPVAWLIVALPLGGLALFARAESERYERLQAGAPVAEGLPIVRG